MTDQVHGFLTINPRHVPAKFLGAVGEDRLRADGKPCPYCGRLMRIHGERGLWPTRDHVLPLSKQGTAILMACWDCNHRKGDIMPDEFLETLSGCQRTVALIAMIGALKQELAR